MNPSAGEHENFSTDFGFQQNLPKSTTNNLAIMITLKTHNGLDPDPVLKIQCKLFRKPILVQCISAMAWVRSLL